VHSIERAVREEGGLASAAKLRERGFSPGAIAWAVRSQVLVRPRKGWYVCAGTPRDHVIACRVGGRLTDLTAAEDAGVWTPPHAGFHVALAHQSCRPRARRSARLRIADGADPGVVLHWNDAGQGSSPFVLPVDEWMREVIRTRALTDIAAVADSALKLGRLSLADWRQILAGCPRRVRRALAIVDGVPESGTESIVRMALWLAGVPSQAQVAIGAFRVDLLVGERLIIELDSEGHHGGRAARLRDIHRDAALVELGFVVMHFDYTDVIDDLSAVIMQILAVIARGAHRGSRPL